MCCVALPKRGFAFGILGGKRRVMISASLLATIAAAVLSPTQARLTNDTATAAANRNFPIVLTSTRKRKYDLEIPAGSLSMALIALGQQTAVKVAADADVISDRSTIGLRGRYTAEQALRQLTSASGLRFKRVSGIGFAIVAPPVRTAQATELQGIVIVGGETVERSRQESSTSVTVLTGDELDSSPGIVNVYDLVEQSPNVTSTFDESGFSIRGVDTRGPGGTGIGDGPLINVIVDGVSLPTIASTFRGTGSTWDLEQVEVLRGPQSTQQGRNALAGAIIVRSKDPFHGREVKVRKDLETLGGWRSAFAVNEQIVPGSLSFRISGERYHTDGSIDAPNLDRDDFDYTNNWTGRAKLLWTPSEKLEVIAGYTILDAREGSSSALARFFPDRRTTLTGVNPSLRDLNHSANLRINYRIDNVFSLKTETTFFDGLIEATTGLAGQPDPAFTRFSGDDSESYSHESKITFDANWIKGAVGVFYTDVSNFNEVDAIFSGSALSPFLPAGTLLGIGSTTRRKVENYAIFGEADIKPFDNWVVTLGARYDRERIQTTAVSTIDIQPPSPFFSIPPTSEQFEAEFEAFLPKFGLAYDFTDDVRMGGVIQRGYRAGGAGINAGQGRAFEFDPEFTWNYEVYVRSQLFNKRLTINANLFYTDWIDQQVRITDPTNSSDTEIVNAGSSRSFGGEIELKARVTDSLDLFGNFGYVNNRFEDFVSGANNFSGNEFPSSPEYTASAGGVLRFGRGWELHSDVSYTGEYFSSPDNDISRLISQRFLTNGKLGYKAENWEAFLFARNIFDVDYIFNKTNTGTQDEAASVGEPRIVGITAKARF